MLEHIDLNYIGNILRFCRGISPNPRGYNKFFVKVLAIKQSISLCKLYDSLPFGELPNNRQSRDRSSHPPKKSQSIRTANDEKDALPII